MRDWQSVVAACYGPQWKHPLYRYYDYVAAAAQPGALLVDAGCGRDMPLRASLSPGVRYLGIDRVGGLRADLEHIPLRSECADLIVSKSVMEHVKRPERVFAELGRVLRPRGRLIILTPNLWDITSVAARLIPNSLHPRIVRFGEGRAEADTFPTYYLANSEYRLRSLCAKAKLRIERLEYWGQYPSILHRWPRLLYFGCWAAKLLDRFDSLRKLRGWIFLVATKS